MNPCVSEEKINDFYENNIVFDIDSIMILENYLQDRLKSGSNSMRTIKNILYDLFYYTKTTKIEDINRGVLTGYFREINQRISRYNRPYSIETKKSKYVTIKAFFNYFESVKDGYTNPFPKRHFKFSPPPILTLEESEKIKKDKIFTIEEIKYIFKKFHDLNLSSSYFTQREMFHITLLLTFCGMRITEALSIKKNAINLEEGFLSTGTEPNARKSKKLLTFIIPYEIIPFLKNHLLELNSRFPDSEWLFPSQYTHGEKWLGIHAVEKALKKIQFANKKYLPYMFRRSLTTYRLNDETHRCPTHIEETLSCHSPSAIIYKNYDQYSLKERKRDYLQFFPEEYKKILEFLKTL